MSSTQTPAHPTEDIKALLHEAEQALSNARGAAGEEFDELRAKLRASIKNGSYSLEHLRAEAVRRARQADQLVRENPYYAIGIAAGVGAVIALLISRSCNSSR